MNNQYITELFTAAGGEFLLSADELHSKLDSIHGFVFDWDGVFNTGGKAGQQTSGFTEADAMGINLLRFGYWLKHDELPFTAIITGEHNPAAEQLAEREHFTALYLKTPNKTIALRHINEQFELQSAELSYCFDDVLDLPIAEVCGLRCLVRRAANPLFIDYVTKHNLCDYITANDGAKNAVREYSELLLGLSGQYRQAVSERCAFSDNYQRYLDSRNAIITEIYAPEA